VSTSTIPVSPLSKKRLLLFEFATSNSKERKKNKKEKRGGKYAFF
jgi:hypothetical protein